MQPIVFYAFILCLFNPAAVPTSLLCLLLSSMHTQSPAPVSTCTESICLVILPSVLHSLPPTVCIAVFMYSTYIYYGSYAYLVCYDYILVMPTDAVSIAYLVSYGLPCYAYPVTSAYLVFYTYAWSAVPTCLSSHLCLILVLLYSLLCFGSVQHFMCTLMFNYVMQLDTYIRYSSTLLNISRVINFYSQF